jgi:hypothetical protein
MNKSDFADLVNESGDRGQAQKPKRVRLWLRRRVDDHPDGSCKRDFSLFLRRILFSSVRNAPMNNLSTLLAAFFSTKISSIRGKLDRGPRLPEKAIRV